MIDVWINKLWQKRQKEECHFWIKEIRKETLFIDLFIINYTFDIGLIIKWIVF